MAACSLQWTAQNTKVKIRHWIKKNVKAGDVLRPIQTRISSYRGINGWYKMQWKRNGTDITQKYNLVLFLKKQGHAASLSQVLRSMRYIHETRVKFSTNTWLALSHLEKYLNPIKLLISSLCMFLISRVDCIFNFVNDLQDFLIINLNMKQD